MKRAIAAAFAACLIASPAAAQTAAPAQVAAPAVKEDFKPSALNQPGQQFPQVNSRDTPGFASSRPKPRASA